MVECPGFRLTRSIWSCAESFGLFLATPSDSSSICLSLASRAAILAEVLCVCVCISMCAVAVYEVVHTSVHSVQVKNIKANIQVHTV